VAAATPDDALPALRGLDLPDLDLPELEAAAEPVPDRAGLDPRLPDSAVPAVTAVPPGAVAQEDTAPPVAAATPDDAQDGAGTALEASDAGESSGELLAGFEAARQPAAPVSPEVEAPPTVPDGSVDADGTLYKQIGDLRISASLYNVYLSEADEWSRQLLTELSEWTLELERPVSERAMAGAHSLAGSSATVGFTALSELARAIEHALLRLVGQPRGTAEQAQALGAAAQEVRRVLDQFAAGLLMLPEASIIKAVQALMPTEAPRPPLIVLRRRRINPPTPPEPPHTVAVPDGPLPQPAPAAATQASAAVPQQHRIGDDIQVADAVDAELFPIFEEEAQELLPRLSAALRQWTGQPDDQSARGEALRALHTFKGSARLAGALRLGEMAHRAESAIERIDAAHPHQDDLAPLLDYLDELLGTFRQLQADRVGMAGVAAEPSSALPQEPAAQPSAAAAVTAVQPAAEPTPAVRGEVAGPTELSLVTVRAAASQAVRVRSQLLDQLVNQASEVLASRTRLESEVAQLRSSLNDLTGNLERLRQQLRDVELQAEMQLQSNLAQSKDAQQNFDPLEFDRFTRMQELTRMMAESVNDIATVQRSLQRAVDASEDNLAAQAQQSRELRRDLLRTRMADFESISERLYSVVRQASKETDKRVRLDIVGGAIEIDRAILERMTPAFEHLLRNGVVHGIEAPALRAAQGKDPVGSMVIEVHQLGNDVSIEFRDDGAGLDLAGLRERALRQGRITAGQKLSDAELRNLIFLPGLSTVDDVTKLAGRGVGLDVVRTEVRAIGGRIETDSSAGNGSAFRLVLPLTTAVTHVLMVRAGDLAVGVPANLVERVRRVSEQDLKLAYQSGHYRFDNEELPFFWAGALLQHSARSVEPDRSVSVVIFRSADQRVVVHVDEVLGNQEVVIKPLGPQLARLPGLVAMTALASGTVALIYNPVALVAVYGAQAQALSAEAAAPPVASAAVPPRASNPLVLVVDDSITMRRVTQRLLQREGYRVALAADGLQGLERLQAERPAVVLSDIEMPRMDGFDFVRNIRADANLRDLPVIMITSRIAEKHREHARQLDVDHYLGKPYAEAELLELIHSYTHAAADVAQ
ncbi:MAG: response regulator, partial [Burkholderiaceae bacterium]|nr:response regulator [Burkholderiaceae bacterium]